MSTPDAFDPSEVLATISLPRLSFTDNWGCSQHVFQQLGIKLAHSGGAYWDQSLSRLLNAGINEGYKYVITIDYDTIFLEGQVRELIRLIKATPDALAIWGAQMRQHSDVLLCGLYEEDGQTPKNYTPDLVFQKDELTQATAGHFGLTIFRCDKLKQLPKPWMTAKANSNGDWDTGKIDADWSFWLNAHKAGLKSYQANKVRLGHMQTIVTWPGDDFQPVHQYLMDYRENGEPEVVHAYPGASDARPRQTRHSTYTRGRRKVEIEGDEPHELVVKDGKTRLNLGSGEWGIPGYTNIDRKSGKEAYPLDCPDSSVDVIRASHLLEHFGFREIPLVLKDWIRALKPGGVLKIAVPDFDHIIKSYQTSSGKPWPAYLFGSQSDENDFHKAPFCERDLITILTQVGLTDLTRWTSEINDCAAMDVSLNIQGIKPFPDDKTEAA